MILLSISDNLFHSIDIFRLFWRLSFCFFLSRTRSFPVFFLFVVAFDLIINFIILINCGVDLLILARHLL